MTRFLQLNLNDFRNIFREQILWMMYFVAPLLQFLAARLLLPWLEAQFPVLQEYRPVIIMLMILQIVAGIGFVLGMILLDEKDEEVLTAIRVLPVSADAFLFSRLGGGILVSFVFGVVMLTGTGAFQLPPFTVLGGALLFALVAPVVMLALAGLARNKVEGLALFKGLNTILLLPIISLFIASGWQYLFAVIPVYWSMHFLVRAAEGQQTLFFFAGGVLMNLLAVGILYAWFRRRVFG